jgi:hypothetical protein
MTYASNAERDHAYARSDILYAIDDWHVASIEYDRVQDELNAAFAAFLGGDWVESYDEIGACERKLILFEAAREATIFKKDRLFDVFFATCDTLELPHVLHHF